MKMKLLVTATTFPRWRKDKEATFVLELSKQLMKNGLDVNILAPDSKGAKKYDVYEGLKVHRFQYFFPRGMQKLAYGGMLPNIRKNPFLLFEVPFFVLFEFLAALKIVKKEKIDMIHSHWLVPQGFIGAILRKFFGVKHVLTIHAGGIFALSRLPFKRQIANFIVNNSDAITAVSGSGKKILMEMISSRLKRETEKKTKIIPMGVYTKNFASSIGKNVLKRKYGIKSKHTILFIGRIAEKKGLEYLIRAMSFVKKEVSGVKLIVVGEGPLRNQLEKLSEGLGLKKNVSFVGYKVGKDKINYLLLSDILVVPSIVAKSGDTEGLPVVLMEALASGLPIVATDVGGIKDLLIDNKNGFLINQKNSKEMTDSVCKLLKNKELKEKFSKTSLKESKKYDWDVIANEYAKLFLN